MMFLSLETYAVVSIIGVVLVQYALATFCLVKLAFLDISKKEYVLWNVFILLVFFIGDIAFLIYWSKVKDKKKIPPLSEVVADKSENIADSDGAEVESETTETAETVEAKETTETDVSETSDDGE